MMKYEVENLHATVAETFLPTCQGKMRAWLINWTDGMDTFPTIIVASALLIDLRMRGESGRPEIILSHLTVDEVSRRQGIGARIVAALEREMGQFRSAWVSDAGCAFAREYVMRHGPRPLWQIGANPEIARKLSALGFK